MLPVAVCEGRSCLRSVSGIWIWTLIVLLLQNGQLFPSSVFFSFFPFHFCPFQMWNIGNPGFGCVSTSGYDVARPLNSCCSLSPCTLQLYSCAQLRSSPSLVLSQRLNQPCVCLLAMAQSSASDAAPRWGRQLRGRRAGVVALLSPLARAGFHSGSLPEPRPASSALVVDTGCGCAAGGCAGKGGARAHGECLCTFKKWRSDGVPYPWQWLVVAAVTKGSCPLVGTETAAATGDTITGPFDKNTWHPRPRPERPRPAARPGEEEAQTGHISPSSQRESRSWRRRRLLRCANAANRLAVNEMWRDVTAETWLDLLSERVCHQDMSACAPGGGQTPAGHVSPLASCCKTFAASRERGAQEMTHRRARCCV